MQFTVQTYARIQAHAQCVAHGYRDPTGPGPPSQNRARQWRSLLLNAGAPALRWRSGPRPLAAPGPALRSQQWQGPSHAEVGCSCAHVSVAVAVSASESKQPAGLGISPDTIFFGDSEYYSDLASLSRTLRVRVLNVLWQRRPQVGRKNLVLAVRVTV